MKILFKSFILLILAILVTSCTNEDFNNEIANNNDNTKMLQRNSSCANIDKLAYQDNEGIRKEILVFTSTDDFFEQTECLEEFEERYEEEFLSTVPSGVSEEELNELDEEYGFNEYQVYLDFNRELEFTSLIHKYIDAERDYLNTEELPEELDPDVLFFGLEEPEMAILNIDKAYMIKNKQHQFIVVFYVDGILVITDGSIDTLNDISNAESIENIDGIEKISNVQVLDPPTYNSCVTSNREQDYRRLSRKKRIKGVIKLKAHQAVWFDDNGNGIRDPSGADSYITIVKNKIKVKAKTIKKRWWGGWWRYRVGHIKAALGGEAGQGACVGDVFFDKDVEKKEKRNRAKVKYKHIAPNGTINGIYASNNRLWGYFSKSHRERFRLDFYNGTYERLD